MPDETVNMQILSAMQELWSAMLEIREFTNKFIFFQSILLPSEYAEVLSEKRDGMVLKISRNEFESRAFSLAPKVEMLRPLVGESIWAKFFVYRAFALRQAYKVQVGVEKGKLYDWSLDLEGKHDSGLQQMLTLILDEQQVSQFYNGEKFETVRKILSIIESLILQEMSDWIFERNLHKIDKNEQQSIQTIFNVAGNLTISSLAGRDMVATVKQ